jgi:hypothetical protein
MFSMDFTNFHLFYLSIIKTWGYQDEIVKYRASGKRLIIFGSGRLWVKLHQSEECAGPKM